MLYTQWCKKTAAHTNNSLIGITVYLTVIVMYACITPILCSESFYKYNDLLLLSNTIYSPRISYPIGEERTSPTDQTFFLFIYL